MKRNELNLPALPLDRFTSINGPDGWDLSAEASDFGPMCDGLWWLGQLYDDSADVGIAIESFHTGRVCRFHLDREERDGDGDLLAWHFMAVDSSSPVKSVTIFND